MEDLVNHPPHYADDKQFKMKEPECIFISRWMNFDAGNAFKYVWRAGKKGSAKEDLEKALFYLRDWDKMDAKRADSWEKFWAMPEYTEEHPACAFPTALEICKLMQPWDERTADKFAILLSICWGDSVGAKRKIEKMLEAYR